jgi:outer membrane protein insertion porin family
MVSGSHAAHSSTAKEQLYTIVINGNSSITKENLLKAADVELQTFEKKGYRKADIDDAAFQMRAAYLQAGFAFVVVDYTYEKKEKTIQVIFNIQEGPRVNVEKIILQGNRKISTEILLVFFQDNGQSPSKKQQIVFVGSKVREAINRMREHYLREGFFDVAVKRPDLAFNENRSGVTITISIDEGPQYIIRDVRLEGDLIPDLNPKLKKIKSTLTGKPYYVRRKLFLRTSLEGAYDAIGYADADINIEVVRQDEPGSIILIATITSGVRVRIADVVISGNKYTRKSFIRNRLQLKPGDIYSRKKRTESFRKLYDSGLFAKINIELMEPGNDGSRVLGVEVEELPSREYYIEPGWGSYEELRLRAGAFEKNLFGTGKNGRLDGLVSFKGETITLSYTDPWLLHTNITMNVSLYYEHRDEPSYTFKEKGLAALFSKKLSKNLTLSTGYKYKIIELFDLDNGTPLEKEEDDYNQGTLGIQAVWDTRDDIFFPSKGLRLAGVVDISLPALGSDIEFGRITMGGRYFIRLPQEYILGLRATTGLIIPINNQTYIPISERFFNGGDNTVRSYEHSELGPKDNNNDPVGGLGYNVFSIELRKKIYRNFAATLYVDAGNVSPNRSFLEKDLLPYTDRSELIDDTLKDFFSEFKFAVGIGLQYLLPVGPMRFDFAYNPDPEKVWNEDSWVFHFSLGMAF